MLTLILVALALAAPAMPIAPGPEAPQPEAFTDPPRKPPPRGGKRRVPPKKRQTPPVRQAIGASVSLAAFQTSARHHIVPVIQGWATFDKPRQNWGGTTELLLGYDPDKTSTYRFDTFHARLAVVPELTFGTHAARFHVGAGPAVTWRMVRLNSNLDKTSHLLQPGLRLRMAIQGPIADSIALTWHIGLTTRYAGFDFDSGFGAGVKF